MFYKNGLRCCGILVTCSPPSITTVLMFTISRVHDPILAKCGRRLDQESGSLLASLCALKIFFLEPPNIFLFVYFSRAAVPLISPRARSSSSRFLVSSSSARMSAMVIPCHLSVQQNNCRQSYDIIVRSSGETTLNMVEHLISKDLSLDGW